jgi:arabinose-5-phosphate isomerase
MKYFGATLKILENALRTIREDEFDAIKRDCLSTLEAGGKLVATGLGKNVPICEKFVGTLNSVGVDAAFMHTNSAVHGDLGVVRGGDLVIILTKSGETSESIYLANLLKKRDCGLWLLSFSRDSTLYRETPNRLIVELEHEGDRWDVLPNNSSLLNLIVLQELAMRIVEELDIPLDVLRRNHPGGAIGAGLSTDGK